MSILSKKIEQIIDSELESKKRKIGKNVDIIIKNLRLGKDQGKNLQKTLEVIGKVTAAVVIVKSVIKTVKSAQESIEAAKIAAETTRKAATIGSALNPASAAIGVAQEFVIAKLDIEVEDAKNALNVAPKLIENFETFMVSSKNKLEKAKEEKEEKDKFRKEQLKKATGTLGSELRNK